MSTNSEIRHDYVYAVTPKHVAEGGPCATHCGYQYRTSIPESVFSPECGKCGQKMKYRVVSKELSENQYRGE